MKTHLLIQKVFLLATVPWLAACGGEQSDQSDARAYIRGALERADSTTVLSLVAGDTLHLSQETVEFYRRNRWRPAWSEDGKLNAQGRNLVRVLSNTERDGLSPLRYRYDIAYSMLAALREKDDDKELPDDVAQRYVADLDVLFTEGFARYALDLAQGTLDPEQAGLEWEIPRGSVPKGNLLRALLRGADPEEMVGRLRPTAPQYERLMSVLARLHEIRVRGGWPQVPEGSAAPGDSSELVSALRQRLAASEDIREAALARRGQARAAVFDNDLHQALEHFQQRHAIHGDGRLGSETHRELNHSVTERIAEVKLNMDRWRWLPHDLGRMYLLVNVAGFEMQVVENGRAIEEMNVVVGKPGWATPIFADTLEHLVVNPYWNVPASIMEEEIRPAIARDPTYLTRNNFEWTRDGRVRQRPGPRNALGQFKFLFPNDDNIYLHDTPADELFSRSRRAFSHGCIRVERPRDLAYLLGDKLANMSRAEIDRLADSERERWVNFRRQIPVYVLYFTTWVDDDGTPRFHHDVYGMNQKLEQQRPSLDQRAT